MTAPVATVSAADPRRRTRQRLLIAMLLIGLAAGGLVIFERLHKSAGPSPAPHEPSQALIAPPASAPDPEEQARPAAPPPPPVVVNEPEVPPAAAPGTPRTQAAAPERAAYLVQAGVFGSAANARSLQARLAKAGIRAKVETRVQLGPYNDRRDAEQAMVRLKGLGIDAVMVPAR